MNPGQVTYIVNLLQDINTLRPLVYLAAHKLNLNTRFLVTTAFRKRDKTGVWQHELNEIANETRSPIHEFENEFQALQVLQDGHGVLVAGSESHLNNHKPVHDLFRVAPSNYVKITLQHGFECVGFLQSRDQNLAHGSNITFAADIICGWCAPERLTSVAPSQRHKLRVTGPTSLLSVPIKKGSGVTALQAVSTRAGLVCENMHSPRLNVAGDFKSEFLDIFEKFCSKLALEGRRITLRPHPGGQFVIKNDVPLLPNVALENSPIYKVDLEQFAYGISAPSSILIDMVLAGIPTAVWQDEDSVMDLGNYEGLTRISTLNEWLIFANDAVEHREKYLEKQQTFLRKQKLIINQKSVLQEFSALLLAAVRDEYTAVMSRVNSLRILLITPNVGATIQFGFIKPLTYAVASGNAIVEIIEEVELNAQLKAERSLFFEGSEWLLDRIKQFKPTLAIFCRWSGPHAKLMSDYFYKNNIATIFYLDDDLLSVPKNIGIDKWVRYNEPRRLASLQHLLNQSDLVYASTNTLKHRLEKLRGKPRVLAGEIISSHHRLNSPRIGRVKKIGYMGIGHEEDLEMILGPIIRYLRNNTCVSFELFGTIPMPSALLEFGDRISKIEKVADYDEFLSLLPCLEWDVGICPLTKIQFNFLKSNVKWIEYSSAGIPVIASGGTVYDECCADGCGVLANTEEDWYDALEYLTCNADERLKMVVQAQKKLRRDYSQSRMRNQVLSMIQSAIQYHANETALSANSFTTRIVQERILFVAKSFSPTVEIYFTNPLRDLIDDGVFLVDFVSENHIYSVEKKKSSAINKIGMSDLSGAECWIIERFNSFSPSILVLVRYSGPHSELLVRLARARRIPIIYHIDDDLLNVPVNAGLEKQNFHNKPERLSVVRSLLKTSTLVFCSTKALMNQIMALEDSAPATTTQITCALNVQSGVRSGPVRKIGYMGGADHVNDFSTIVGALVLLLRKHTQITFEFFGGMQIPERLKEFGDRVKHIHPSINYEKFLARFSACEWDIGLCPLDKVYFNLMKTPIKWFDYTSIGAAVVATRGTVYDDVCAGNCGGLAGSEMEWFDVLDDLINNPSVRYLMAANAQNKLKQNYSVGSYKNEILNLFNQAHQLLQDHSPHKAAV